MRVQYIFLLSPSILTIDGSAGLAGIPPVFSAIRGDLGFLHPEWDQLGKDWQGFVRKWLPAEMALTKAGRSIMEVQELQETDLPAALKTWGTAQITKASFDFSIVTEEFGKEMLSWWDGLGLKQDGGVDRILSFPWCRNGTAGIVMLVLGMRWWGEQAGSEKKWLRVLKEITGMWDLIAAAPPLCVFLCF